MRLVDLEPATFRVAETDAMGPKMYVPCAFVDAMAIKMLCPKCLRERGSRPGVHSIMLLLDVPGVDPKWQPGPGRWELVGTSFDDASLVAGSSSVLLTAGCRAHFFVTNGEIRET